MLLEDCPESRAPVKLDEPHYKVFPEFRGSSYMVRYELLLRRLVREGLYNSAALLAATESGGPVGAFSEPAEDLMLRKFLAGLGGHVSAYLAGR
jgi:type II restriction enzyme